MAGRQPVKTVNDDVQNNKRFRIAFFLFVSLPWRDIIWTEKKKGFKNDLLFCVCVFKFDVIAVDDVTNG